MAKLVRGIGFNECKYPTTIGGEWIKEYVLWTSMLSRCTDKIWAKYPTYTGTTCSENFKSFSYFYEWYQKQNGFGNMDENSISWHLDKDLLVKDNKIYSEHTCVLVPPRINTLLVKNDANRGSLPIGVSLKKQLGKYVARCRDGSHATRHLGYYYTIKEAFQAYKNFKEQLIKDVANEYREQLDIRAYQALMQYEVNIDD